MLLLLQETPAQLCLGRSSITSQSLCDTLNIDSYAYDILAVPESVLCLVGL